MPARARLGEELAVGRGGFWIERNDAAARDADLGRAADPECVTRECARVLSKREIVGEVER